MPGWPLNSTAFFTALLLLFEPFFPLFTETPWCASHCKSQSRICFTCHHLNGKLHIQKLCNSSIQWTLKYCISLLETIEHIYIYIHIYAHALKLGTCRYGLIAGLNKMHTGFKNFLKDCWTHHVENKCNLACSTTNTISEFKCM